MIGDSARTGPRLERRRRLLALARDQGGVFDDAQAAECGFDARARSYHRRAGNWLPTVAPGVWQLAEWTAGEHADAVAWACWFGPDFQATSWTALELHGIDLGDLRATSDDTAVPTDIALRRPVSAWRADQRRARRATFDAVRSGGRIVLHAAPRDDVAAERRDGIAVRPLAEALCIAVCRRRGATADVPRETAGRLLDRVVQPAAITASDLRWYALAMGAARVLDLLEER